MLTPTICGHAEPACALEMDPTVEQTKSGSRRDDRGGPP
jgi:hypothetical protein